MYSGNNKGNAYILYYIFDILKTMYYIFLYKFSFNHIPNYKHNHTKKHVTVREMSSDNIACSCNYANINNCALCIIQILMRTPCLNTSVEIQ